MPDKSKVMMQTKTGTLVLQVGGLTTPTLIAEKLLTMAARRKHLKRPSKMNYIRVGTRNVLFLYRSGALPGGARRVEQTWYKLKI
jgi:hypothetical protein